MSALSATDLLLIRAAAAGELTSRLSRGYDDGRPEGWPVLCFRNVAVSDDDTNRLQSLEEAGYLTWDDDEGPIEATAAGREAIR